MEALNLKKRILDNVIEEANDVDANIATYCNTLSLLKDKIVYIGDKDVPSQFAYHVDKANHKGIQKLLEDTHQAYVNTLVALMNVAHKMAHYMIQDSLTLSKWSVASFFVFSITESISRKIVDIILQNLHELKVTTIINACDGAGHFFVMRSSKRPTCITEVVLNLFMK